MTTWMKWIGTGSGILGALWIAVNIASSGWGFVLFVISSTCWIAAGWRMREPSLVLLHSAFNVVNCIGIYRWLLA